MVYDDTTSVICDVLPEMKNPPTLKPVGLYATCTDPVSQLDYRTCWAFASSLQFECNYNLFNGWTGTNRLKLNRCYTVWCSRGSIFPKTQGGWHDLSNKYFVEVGACVQSGFDTTYGKCMSDPLICEGQCSANHALRKASNCYSIDTGDITKDYQTITHYLVKYSFAMNIPLFIGKNFWYVGDHNYPLGPDAVCGGENPDIYKRGWVGTVIGLLVGGNNPKDGTLRIQNSWGKNWGNNGYFRISLNTFKECYFDWHVRSTTRISFNTFQPIPSEDINNDTSG